MNPKQGQKYIGPEGQTWILDDAVSIYHLFDKEAYVQLILQLDVDDEDVFLTVHAESFKQLFFPVIDKNDKIKQSLDQAFLLPAYKDNLHLEDS